MAQWLSRMPLSQRMHGQVKHKWHLSEIVRLRLSSQSGPLREHQTFQQDSVICGYAKCTVLALKMFRVFVAMFSVSLV